jgi:outer membrane protein assembly factor BamB
MSPNAAGTAVVEHSVTVRVLRPSRGLLLVALAALLAACGGHSATTSSTSRRSTTAASSQTPRTVPDGDWKTFDYGPQRSGVGRAGTGITSGNVSTLRRRVVRIDGVADSSPIQLHRVRVRGRLRDVVIVTTTYGRTIALDPASGAKFWEYVPSNVRSYQGTPQITTASPVASADRAYVYSASPDGVIHELRLSTGAAVWSTRITSDPTREKIAAALNVSGPYVVAVTGGYFGDAPTYQGHVALINRGSGRLVHVFNSLCSDRHELMDPPSSCPASGSAIWARAGAVVESGTGRLLLATGNAPFNGSTNWGDSVLELSPDARTLLRNWTPTNQAQLNGTDGDLGSTGPAVLPGRLAVQGGKSGSLALLDLSRLSGTTGGPSSRQGGELQTITAPGGGEVLTAPAVWTTGGRTYVFVANDSGTAAYGLSGRRLHVAWHDGTPGTSPVLAGDLLYVYDQLGGTLRVLRPTTGRAVATLAAASGHWNSPIVVGGRVILPVGGGTAGPDHVTSGRIFVYHLPGR